MSGKSIKSLLNSLLFVVIAAVGSSGAAHAWNGDATSREGPELGACEWDLLADQGFPEFPDFGDFGSISLLNFEPFFINNVTGQEIVPNSTPGGYRTGTPISVGNIESCGVSGITNLNAQWVGGTTYGSMTEISIAFSGVLGNGVDAETIDSIVTGDGITIYEFLYRLQGAANAAPTPTVTITPAAPPNGVPSITSHATNGQLAGEVDTFTWDVNDSGDEFWVYAGSALGAYDYFNSGSLGSNNSVTVNNLPNDGVSPVYLRLWFRTGAEPWDVEYPDTYIDFQYQAGEGTAGSVQITAPSSALGSSPTVEWLDPQGSVQYWVYAGSNKGSSSFYDSGPLQGGTTQHEINYSQPPTAGDPVWIRLWYRPGAAMAWQFVDANYGIPTLSPDSSLQLPLSLDNQLFTFTDLGGAVKQWWLYAGTSKGLLDIANSGDLMTTSSYEVTGIDELSGNPLYIRLWYKINGRWFF